MHTDTLISPQRRDMPTHSEPTPIKAEPLLVDIPLSTGFDVDSPDCRHGVRMFRFSVPL